MMGQKSLMGPTSSGHRAQLVLANGDDFLQVLALQLLHHQGQLEVLRQDNVPERGEVKQILNLLTDAKSSSKDLGATIGVFVHLYICEEFVHILPDSVHTGLLADGVNVRAGDPVGPRHVVLQVHLVTQIHLGGDGGEDEQQQQGRVQSVLPVRRHDHLHVGRLVEAVHLVEQLQQDALDLPVGDGLRVKPLGCP